MFTHTSRLPYMDALPLYRQLKNGGASCLFESASASDKSSRMSVIGLEPPLELEGKDDRLSVRLLHPRAQVFYNFIKTEFAAFVEHEAGGRLELKIPRTPFHGPEEERLERQNIAQPLRRLLSAFPNGEKNFMGLYGALSYRFVYLFEDIKTDKTCPEPDFHLFLFDNILLFNHLTKDLTLYVTRESDPGAEVAMHEMLSLVAASQTSNSKLHPEASGSNFKLQTSNFKLKIGPFQTTPDDETFKRQVEQGIRLCNEGELLEIVLSRRHTATVQGDLLPLYERYKAINPSVHTCSILISATKCCWAPAPN
jgi:anthranilate/para-aminobenzoate synthase component I